MKALTAAFLALTAIPAQADHVYMQCPNLPSCLKQAERYLAEYKDPSNDHRDKTLQYFRGILQELNEVAADLGKPKREWYKDDEGIMRLRETAPASAEDKAAAGRLLLRVQQLGQTMDRARVEVASGGAEPRSGLPLLGQISTTIPERVVAGIKKQEQSLPQDAKPSEVREVGKQYAEAVSPENAERLYEQARAAQSKGGGEGGPSSADYAEVAKQYLDQGRPADAQRAAGRALALDSNNAEAYLLRSQARLAEGRSGEAADDARRALSLDPGNKKAAEIVNYAASSSRAGRKIAMATPDFGPAAGHESGPAARARPEAKIAATQGASGAGAQAMTYSQELVKKAAGKLRLGDLSGALLDLSQAIDADPKNGAAWALRAEVLNKLKNYAAAIQSATEALTLEPENAAALRARAYAEIQTGDYHQALADAQRAVELDPKNALGYLYRAMAYEKLGDAAKALADYETAAQLDPGLQTFLDEARRRLGGKLGAAPPPPGRLLLVRWGAAAVAFLLIALGFLSSSAGQRLSTTARSWLTGKSREASPSATLPPGAVLGRNYRVVRELGRGGMGVVYEAEDLALERRVAIKQMRRRAEATAEDWEGFLGEARLVAKLKHPCLAEIHNVVVEEDLYLVFDLIEGRPLSEVLRQNVRLAPDRARRILGDVCGGMDYAHGQKIIHRDLKPSNVMVAADGSCKITDFGIAHQSRTASQMTQTAASGTPPYMAPEQGMGSVSKASDLYAIGVMAYEVLTGRRPFEGPDFLDQKLRKSFSRPSSVDPALPKALDGFFDKALDPDPTRRFASAGELLKAFEAASGVS